MNILLIGFRYHEIQAIQDRLHDEFSQMKVDFAISIRDSWFRFKFTSYDLIILDATPSGMDSLATYHEISTHSEGVPVVLVINNEETKKLFSCDEKRPQYLLVKDDRYVTRLIGMLKKGEEIPDESNLSQHLQLKENLQRAWYYFTASINMNTDPVCIINNEFEIKEINDAFSHAFHQFRKDVIGKKCYQVIHKLKAPCRETDWTCPLREVIHLGVAYSGWITQLQAISKNGVKLKMDALPIYDDTHQLDQVMVSFRMENHEKKVESPSLFDRSLLELMLSGLSDGLLFCSSENKVIFLNQTAEYILGLPKAKLIGTSVFDLPLGEGAGWLVEVLSALRSSTRFNSLTFKTQVNEQIVQIRFAPVYGPEKHYVGGFLYLTELIEFSRNEANRGLSTLEDKVFNLRQLIFPNIIAEG